MDTPFTMNAEGEERNHCFFIDMLTPKCSLDISNIFYCAEYHTPRKLIKFHSFFLQDAEFYVALLDYDPGPHRKDDLHLSKGDLVQLISSDSGWMFVVLVKGESDQQGWVPETYLQRKPDIDVGSISGSFSMVLFFLLRKIRSGQRFFCFDSLSGWYDDIFTQENQATICSCVLLGKVKPRIADGFCQEKNIPKFY